MAEIVDAYKRGNEHFGVVRLVLAGESGSFEFGVEPSGYRALRRVLQSRPFAETPGITHKYFFAGSCSKSVAGSDQCSFGVRIEGGRGAKNFDFDGPVSLAANLVWFAGLRTLEEASALRRLS
jgi:hypothetical protein